MASSSATPVDVSDADAKAREYAQCFIDVIAEEVKNTEFEEKWEQHLPKCEPTIAALVDCKNEPNPEEYVQQQKLYKTLFKRNYFVVTKSYFPYFQLYIIAG